MSLFTRLLNVYLDLTLWGNFLEICHWQQTSEIFLVHTMWPRISTQLKLNPLYCSHLHSFKNTDLTTVNCYLSYISITEFWFLLCKSLNPQAYWGCSKNSPFCSQMVQCNQVTPSLALWDADCHTSQWEPEPISATQKAHSIYIYRVKN